MKNRNKVLLVAVLAVIAATMAACTGRANPESDFEFTIIGNNEGVRITRYVGNREVVVIPARIQRMPVTEIADRAFVGGNIELTGVTIPNSVRTIGREAFADNQLTSVTIGNNVEFIGREAFADNQLTSVVIPDSVTSIGELAFFDNPLTSITIGENVTVSGIDRRGVIWHAFDRGFSSAYDGWAGMFRRPNIWSTMWTRYDGIQGDFLFVEGQEDEIGIVRYIGSGGAVNIPAQIRGRPVTFITDQAFRGNQLTSVTIPNSVRAIGIDAFADNQLTSITIGENITLSVTFIWGESFWSFGNNGFEDAYNNGGRLAGTWTRPDTRSREWTRQ